MSLQKLLQLQFLRILLLKLFRSTRRRLEVLEVD